MKKIVIEIADDDYNRINSYPDGTTFYPITARLYKAVKDGTPLAEWLNDYKRFLEQKTCEDDISRQAVLEMAYDMSEIDGEHFTKPWMVVDVEDIQKLPSVNPQEPKTGNWEYVQYDYNPRLGNWHCSECRCVIVACVDKNEKSGIPLYKYCPNCGARMVEQQESGEV